MTTGKTNALVASAIFLIMLAVYLMTAAPTLSFWDCGEFITCAFIMGIPHPPGSPLLSILGRVMSMFPFYDFRGVGNNEIAYRVNMIDVILGALTVMLTFLIVARLLRRLRPNLTGKLEHALVMFASAVTAFIIGFSAEFWDNAVETETYMPSLFMQMAALWLTLKWEERKDDSKAVRYLFLAAYILGLGNGVHLTVLLIAPTVFLIVFFAKPEWFLNSKLWLSIVAIGVCAVTLKILSGLGIEYAVMAVFAFVSPYLLWRYHIKTSAARRTEVWKTTLLGLILCGSLYIIGFSVYPTVMVRAGKSPAINEGNPDNWERYKLYMSRDQYGQENMYVGMFTRNAEFKYQFGYMYLRYLIEQFPLWGPIVTTEFVNDKSADTPGPVRIAHEVSISIFLLSLLLYGLYTHGRSDWKTLVALLLFFVASSVGLILYLNMENPQVRERSYFFMGSYYIIMYWLGMGIWGILIDLKDWLTETGRKRALALVTALLMLLFATLPPAAAFSRHIDPKFTNFEVHNRSHDWMPWDYAYNILISCDENAILFTNGDNDTFPLWYLQEVKGIRRDVRLVNLSLLNTDWYNIQLKREMTPLPSSVKTDGAKTSSDPVPIKYTDEYLSKEVCGRDDPALMRRVWPLEGKDVTRAGITWHLPNYHRIPLGNGEMIGMIRVQDEMVANIIHWVDWTRSIYFAVTVASENKIGLDEHLAMEGMVFKLVKEKSEDGSPLVNVPVMDNNVFNRYQYRSLDEPDIYKPPNTVKLVTNYFLGFAQLCDRYSAAKDAENATRAAWGAIKKTPNTFDTRIILYQSLLMYGNKEAAKPFIEWEKATDDFQKNRANRIMLIRLLGAYSMEDEIASLITAELSKPGLLEESGSSIEDRMKLYSIMSIYGFEAAADSLIAVEQKRFIEEGGSGSRLTFGTLLLQNGLDNQSIKFFEDYIKDEPNNTQILNAYLAALFSIGDYARSLEVADKLVALKPDDQSVRQTRDIILKQMEMSARRDSAGIR